MLHFLSGKVRTEHFAPFFIFHVSAHKINNAAKITNII